jgi:hypothetical protein
MHKTSNALVRETKKYLSRIKVPFKVIEDTENILIMKSVGDYHYCIIQFFDFPDGWAKKRSCFKWKTVYGNSADQIVKSVNRYLLNKNEKTPVSSHTAV